MDLSAFFYNALASFLIVIKRSVYLILLPYKTMRSIAQETDYGQIAVIFGLILLYYAAAPVIRPEDYKPLIQLSFVIAHYLATILFIYVFSRVLGHKEKVRSMFFLFAYALIPTLVWFYVNTFLYVLIPPPRTLSILGKVFSIFFVTLSVSILAWKIILWYLAVRFSTALKFYNIVFLAILYIAVAIPYALIMYQMGVFRIPFM